MVITLDKHKHSLGFTTERRARILLTKRRACVYKYYPFTIIIKDVDINAMPESRQPKDTYRIKIDPGAKHTGIAIVRERDNTAMLFLQIEHRGDAVVKKLQTRNACRRNRRQRETRYRRCKWINHYIRKGSKYSADCQRPEGWLPPSVMSIVNNTLNWVDRLWKLVNLSSCSFEAVRFDAQLINNPDIESVQYQQGELFGYEVKEYLLEKYGHTCQYCGGAANDSVLEWEHIQPRSKGGSDSVKNATLACHSCNQLKGNKLLTDWLEEIKATKRPSKADAARIVCIQKVIDGKKTGVGLRYSAWVNSSRTYIEKQLFGRFGNVECSSGGRTKFNRLQLGLPKDHHYDALCVGNVPAAGFKDAMHGYCLLIKANGRGSRKRGQTNACGVITVKYKDNAKTYHGVQTGDIVTAKVPAGKSKYAGVHTGRVAIRKNGVFDIREKQQNGKYTKTPVNSKYVRVLQHTDGYEYQYATK